VIVYQEQVMQIATDLCGFTMAEADALRKAVGKKQRELMEAQREKFITGGAEKGYEKRFVKRLWDLIEKFAEYGFNKAHTVAYGVVSYQTAYLKAHYPVEYMAALLTSVRNNKDNKPLYLNECRRLGIPVRLPDVNASEADFTPRGEEILFGLAAVRGVGEGVVERIVTARTEKGAFSDFADFATKVDATVLNRTVLENLIRAGAFVGLGHPRRGLLAVYEGIVADALSRKRAEAAGQFSLFDEPSGDTSGVDAPVIEVPDDEFPGRDLLKLERELLGLYVSSHPLDGTEAVLAALTDTQVAGLGERGDGATVTIGGVLTAVAKKFTRKGDTYLTGVLEDLTGQVEVVFWPSTYRVAHEVLLEDAVLVLRGRVERRDEVVKLTADAVTPPDLSEALGQPLIVRFAPGQLTPESITRLEGVLANHPGAAPVAVEVAGTDGQPQRFRLGDRFRVERRPGLFGELKAAFGPEAVHDVPVRTLAAPEEALPAWRRAG
jgi:DNA polymerase-3 subunit alpha